MPNDPEVGGIGADPDKDGCEKTDHARIVGECGGAAGHSKTERVTAHLLRDGNFRWKDRRAAKRIGSRERSGNGNLPLTDTLGIAITLAC